jgi:hypothetical protein
LKKYQKKLLKEGSSDENLRYGKSLFQSALELFNDEKFQVSANLFKNLNDYFLPVFKSDKSKYKIKYYYGLSLFYANRFTDAAKILENLLQNPFCDQLVAYSLLDIYKLNKETEKLEKLAKKFSSLKVFSDENIDDLSDPFFFKAGMFFYRLEEFHKAPAYFSRIDKSYEFFQEAKLYSFVSNYVEGRGKLNKFSAFITRSELKPVFVAKASLKLGQIHYKQGRYEKALELFNRVDKDKLLRTDELIISKAWALYKIASKDKNPDYSEVKKLLGKIFSNFEVSDYIAEARALLGYIKKKEANLIGSENDYRYVFDLRTYKRLSDELLYQEDSLKETRRRILQNIGETLRRNDKTKYKKLDTLLFTVDTILQKFHYADLSSATPTVYSDLIGIVKAIKEFEKYRERAVLLNDDKLVQTIDYKLKRYYKIIRSADLGVKKGLFGYNFFSDYPLARKISKEEFNYTKRYLAQEKIEEEKRKINQKLKVLEKNAPIFREEKRFADLAKFEIAEHRLKRAWNRLSSFETINKYFINDKPRHSLDYWANYTAYELTNVQFEQRKKLEEENSDLSNTLRNIHTVLADRKVVFTERVKEIEKNILLMNRRIGKEMRIAERNKNKEIFQTQFFDESKSEVNEDSLRNVLEERSKNIRTWRNVDSTSTDSAVTTLPESENSENNEEKNASNNEAVTDKNTNPIRKEEE